MSGVDGDAPPAPGWPLVGEVNCLEASIGAKGAGKSTHQAIRAYELQRQYGGALVIGHSLGQRMPRSLPPGIYGGAELPITYHRSVGELSREITRRPDRWHVIGAPLTEEDPYPDAPRSSADDLLRYAIRLSYSLRARAWCEAHPVRGLLGVPRQGATFDGLSVPPIIVILDEGIAVGGAAAGDRANAAASDWFVEFVISLRHLHIALLYAIQGPTMRSWKILDQATALHCFRVRHQWSLDALRAAGATEDQLTAIRSLDRFEHVTIS